MDFRQLVEKPVGFDVEDKVGYRNSSGSAPRICHCLGNPQVCLTAHFPAIFRWAKAVLPAVGLISPAFDEAAAPLWPLHYATGTPDLSTTRQSSDRISAWLASHGTTYPCAVFISMWA